MLNLRLLPVVVFAAACLLAVKTIGFVVVDAAPRAGRGAEADLGPRIAGGAKDEDLIITGQTPAPPKGSPARPAKGAEAPAGQSPAERALHERLQERRQELEARARDLELRESLIKAAEKQLDGRIEELKGIEGGREVPDRIKNLVIMYESMGPKEAARVFDRLDGPTLVELVNQMNPRKVAEIVAKMQPEAAERMTLELARRKPAVAEQGVPAGDLRRVEGAKGR